MAKVTRGRPKKNLISENQITCWDFTLGTEFAQKQELVNWLQEYCKEWAFQKEKGSDTGYEHYQGRFKLKVKERGNILKEKIPFPEIHLSVTHNTHTNDTFYVMKADTRIDGPWTSKEIQFLHEMPLHIQEIVKANNWFSWQMQVQWLESYPKLEVQKRELWALGPPNLPKSLIEPTLKHWRGNNPTRRIHIVCAPNGGEGKSTLALYFLCSGLGRRIPYANDYKDIMRMIMCMPEAKTYFFDLPRGIKKEKLIGFFIGIEDLKNGHVFDDRFEYREKVFRIPPEVWIFVNDIDRIQWDLLTSDKWCKWEIEFIPKNSSASGIPDYRLIPFTKTPAKIE